MHGSNYSSSVLQLNSISISLFRPSNLHLRFCISGLRVGGQYSQCFHQTYPNLASESVLIECRLRFETLSKPSAESRTQGYLTPRAQSPFDLEFAPLCAHVLSKASGSHWQQNFRNKSCNQEKVLFRWVNLESIWVCVDPANIIGSASQTRVWLLSDYGPSQTGTSGWVHIVLYEPRKSED